MTALERVALRPHRGYRRARGNSEWYACVRHARPCYMCCVKCCEVGTESVFDTGAVRIFVPQLTGTELRGRIAESRHSLLMGIIVNDGLHRPTIDIRRVGFGMGTPYHTMLEQTTRAGEQVMRTPIALALRAVLAEVVERGTARRVNHAFADDNGVPIRIGGKTGTGDNRIETFARGGRLLSSHVVSRTAGFVFYVGNRWFGVITASVSAPQAQGYTFTSSLPLAVLKLLAPTLDSAIRRECQCQ
jgi:hypothetical protein